MQCIHSPVFLFQLRNLHRLGRLNSQSSSHQSSCPDQSIVSVSGEIVVSSAVCMVLGSEEISGMANKEDLSPLNSVTVGESQQMEVLDNVTNKTTGSSDDFAWLDYVEAETVIGENASVSQKEDAPEMCGKTRLLYKFKIQKSCYFHTKKKAKKQSVVEEMEISKFSSLQQAGKEESCNDSAADSFTSGNVQRDSPMFDNDDNDSGPCNNP
ncbi:hypothetical protein KIW84_061675 [Lathyrus oleraceus]|uniref:Uncharacterized protein n=1 Tax=Pisum sativum TaxID=3888 RepID=A0A9D4W4Y4_PEA|nr:hypothetical protein KIW84_061675 [Pisum sativum]